jgi:hypothetical protein
MENSRLAFISKTGQQDALFGYVSSCLQATKALRESRGIALLCFISHGARRGLGVSVTPRPLATPGNDPVPIVQEAGWAPGPVWIRAKNLAPIGIRSPDRPARSQSPYRLSYRAHRCTTYFQVIMINSHYMFRHLLVFKLEFHSDTASSQPTQYAQNTRTNCCTYSNS